eukprot:808943_1
MPSQKVEQSALKSVLACLAYGTTSLSIILINKAILTEFSFKSPAFMAMVHMGCTLALLNVVKSLGYISFPDISMKDFSKAAPMSFCFMANLVFGLTAVKFVNVPMFTTLRRMTGLITMLLQWWQSGKTPEKTTASCVVVMVAGALVAGWSDLSFSFFGYSAVMINNCLTATYLVLSKNFTE